MPTEEFEHAQQRGAYIGPGVTFKGEISGPELIVIEGIVEGSVTATMVRIGPEGAVTGHLIADDAEIEGTLEESAKIKNFLLLRSSGQVKGQIYCGDLQVERGAVIAGDFNVGAHEQTHPRANASEPTTLHNPPLVGLKLQAAE